MLERKIFGESLSIPEVSDVEEMIGTPTQEELKNDIIDSNAFEDNRDQVEPFSSL